MQFLKKHPFAIVYVLIALALAFFGSRLFGDGTKVGDVIFFAVFCAALLVLPAAELGEKILKALAKLEPRCSPVTGSVSSVDESRSYRRDLELSLVSALTPYLVNNKKADAVGAYIRQVADSILGTPQAAVSGVVGTANFGVAVGGATAVAGAAGQHGDDLRAKADQAADALLVAAGLTAPRVTAEQIQSLMDKLTWRYEQPEGTTSTFAHAFLGRFCVASGHSACVSPENFNAELGMKYAREQAEGKARDKLWELEGYALAKRLGTV